MSSLTTTLSVPQRLRSKAVTMNVAGLLSAAAAMLLQIAAGSTLYPSVIGPIVLVATAILVAAVPSGWTASLALVVPLVLTVGAMVAAVMTGEFIDQLTNLGNPGVFVGSLLHVVALTAAVAGGVGIVVARRAAGHRGR